MADGIAPAIDKVGAPEPSAPEARAGAPTLEAPASTAAGLAHPPNHDGQPDRLGDVNVSDGAGPAVGAQKPVEIKSVPETPALGASPAGDESKPELKIANEPTSPKPLVATGVTDPIPVPTVSAPPSDAAATNGNVPGATGTPATHTGPETETVPATAPAPTVVADAGAMAADAPPAGSERTESSQAEAAAAPTEPAVGEKRGLDKEGIPPMAKMDSPPPAKKARLDDVPAETNGGKAANGSPPARKPGRPRKDKTMAPQMGRTARKTRSQGPAEAQEA